MTHEEYWDYLEEIIIKMKDKFPGMASESLRIVLQLTASPYHYWLENQAVHAQSSLPQESEEHLRSTMDLKTPSEREASDSSNLANKAQEIRSKARTSIKEYMKTHEKQWSSEASTSLWALAADWGKGMTVYKALDLIPDRELCMWNDKHGVFD